MKTDSFEYTVSNHWLSAIVNGDYSSLCDAERIQLDSFLEGAHKLAAEMPGFRSCVWQVETECGHYAKCEVSGLFSDVSDVSLIVFLEEKKEGGES